MEYLANYIDIKKSLPIPQVCYFTEPPFVDASAHLLTNCHHASAGGPSRLSWRKYLAKAIAATV